MQNKKRLINFKYLQKEKTQEIFTGYLMLLPFLVIIFVFIIYPVIYSFRISFMDFTFLNPSDARWVAFKNYIVLFKDKSFLQSIKNTIKMLSVIVPIQTIISLVLANILNSKLRFKLAFRTIYYLPYITSFVAVGAIMVHLFSKNGIISRFLTFFGFDNVTWYADSRYAFYLVAGIIIWTQIGFYMIIYLSALQDISSTVYEAAQIDGANRFQVFFFITIPLLRYTTLLVLIMGVIATLQVFDLPYVISTTGEALPGSPGGTTLTMVMFLYTQAFRYFNIGRASAAAFIIFVIIFIITIGINSFKYFKKEF
jgi:multiple sugar transport system permease protein